MIDPVFKLLPLRSMQETQVAVLQWPDGVQESFLVTSDKYLDFVAQGIMPEPAPELPPPVPVLSREAFCVALIGAGILTEAQATAAALGDWPEQFEHALAGKPLIEKLQAKNLWRRITTVPRDAPLFLDLLAYYGGVMKLSAAKQKALGDAIFAGAAS